MVFDLLEHYRTAAEKSGAIAPVTRLLTACRDRGVMVAYARADHRPDGMDYGRTLTDTDPSFRPYAPGEATPDRHGSTREGLQVLAELAPEPGDYDIPKHRWDAFFQTNLDLSLRSRGVDTVMLVGGSTHVGVAATAYAARDRDYHVVVVRDGCTGYEPQRSFFLDHVFPRMARVRTVDQVVAMLDRGAQERPA